MFIRGSPDPVTLSQAAEEKSGGRMMNVQWSGRLAVALWVLAAVTVTLLLRYGSLIA